MRSSAISDSDAWTWEHQALLRARAVAGDAALARALRGRAPAHACCDAVRRDTLAQRRRWRCACACAANCRRPGPGQFDIKQDAGGIADIEFLVQYWVLAGAQAHPELLTYTDNIRQLEGLAAVGVLDAATAQWLTEAYIGYRTVLHHLSLEGEGDRVAEAAPYAETRARAWSGSGAEAFA